MRPFYPAAIWDFFYQKDNVIYLTFDDGPNPKTTPLLLDLLKQHEAHVTFFCLGKNAQQYPELMKRMLDAGHEVANHGYDHLDGFKTSTADYQKNALAASAYIQSDLYRPAYGRITRSQFKALKKDGFRVVFWSLLTHDFDATLSSQKRLGIIRKKTKAGSILVFHDSEKAISNVLTELSLLLDQWKKEGYSFRSISF